MNVLHGHDVALPVPSPNEEEGLAEKIDRPVKFGIVFDFRNLAPHEKSFPVLYAETLELISFADELGIDYVYLSEHHFVDDAHCPSLLPVAAAIAVRTKQIRISSYVFLLPLHDPL